MSPNFKNRTLFVGDNLDILRGMNSECIDLVYLDPPFNSNRNYSAPVGSKAAGAHFKDTWTWDDVDVAWLGELADQHPRIASVVETTGIAHGRSMKSYVLMMAVRLMELKRVMKPTASIWLHCDDTANSYLRILMDTIFGPRLFRNEVNRERSKSGKCSQHTPKTYGRNVDHLYFYAAQDSTFRPFEPFTEEEARRKYPKVDSDGRRYAMRSLFRGRTLGPRPNLCYEWKGYENPHPSGWMLSKPRLEEEYAKGNVVIRDDGKLERRAYLEDARGSYLSSLWTDVGDMEISRQERLGYPTQKPLALLERIIAACTNEGDFVLDPFAGCATTCIAAEKLGRQWAGIDLSSLAVDLVARRLKETEGLFDKSQAARQAPMRTDIEKPVHYRKQAHVIYGEAEGNCRGCGFHFPFRNTTIDHIVPRSKGGTDHKENLQLLCGACNSMKGTRSQAEFKALLKERGIVQ